MTESKEPLSERELDILRLVATGVSNKEIARQLVISPNTVKVHLRNIFAKIGVTSRTEATLYAIQIGLVNPGSVGAKSESVQAVGQAESALPLQSPGGDEDVPGMGLPGVIDEGQGRDTTAQSQTASRPITLRGLLLTLLAAVLLIAAGMAGARFLSQANLAPAATAQETAASGASETAPLSVPEATAQTQLKNSRWSVKKPMPSPRAGMGAATYENNFYVIGGETAQGIDGAVYGYDPSLDTWSTLAKKPIPVTDIQAALLGERIYIPGGRMADGKETNALEVYNPRQNTWETRAPLPVPLSGYAIATFEGDLYLFGGKNGSQYSSAVYEYDPKADQWTKPSEMSSPRAYAAAITDSEKIYVLGGYDGKHALALNEVYFPTRDPGVDDPWESLTPLPKGRYGMGIAHLINIIYLLGGLQEGAAPADPAGLQYLTHVDQWISFDQPNQPVGAYQALFTSGNFLFTFGGRTPDGLIASGLAYQAIYTISNPIQIKP